MVYELYVYILVRLAPSYVAQSGVGAVEMELRTSSGRAILSFSPLCCYVSPSFASSDSTGSADAPNMDLDHNL